MTKTEAARENLKSFRESWNLKAAQLEREISECAATPGQKSDMRHTLSKLTMFMTDGHDHLARLIGAPEGTRGFPSLRAFLANEPSL